MPGVPDHQSDPLPYELTDKQRHHLFCLELDGMYESTLEFIADDKVTPTNDPDNRLIDKAALEHIRELWDSTFSPLAPVEADGVPTGWCAPNCPACEEEENPNA